MGNCLNRRKEQSDFISLSWDTKKCLEHLEYLRTELHYNQQVLVNELKKAALKSNNRLSVYEKQ